MSNITKKGKCFLCGGEWRWCHECGASGCANASCPNHRFTVSSGGIMSFGGVKCKVCGTK